MKKSKKNLNVKTETVDEYLARGGEITVLPSSEEVRKAKYLEEHGKEEPDIDRVGRTKFGPPNLMDLSEGAFFFAAKKKSRKKPKVPDFSKVDMSLVPDELLAQLGLDNEGTEATVSSDEESSEAASPAEDAVGAEQSEE